MPPSLVILVSILKARQREPRKEADIRTKCKQTENLPITYIQKLEEEGGHKKDASLSAFQTAGNGHAKWISVITPIFFGTAFVQALENSHDGSELLHMLLSH